MVLKLDFEKSYDKLDWKFIFDNLKYRGFYDKWLEWIMKVVVGDCECEDEQSNGLLLPKTQSCEARGPFIPHPFQLCS